MTGRKLKIVFCGCFVLVALATVAMAEGGGQLTPDPAQMQQLQERMLNDPGSMEIIDSLQNDPDMQELLSDPAVAAKIQAGDLNGLANDPRIGKMLDKPKVKELEKRLTDDR